ncbi:AMP-binding enzyme [Halopseudomonas litoralis]|uniref:AMP-binding enzyme n=1 Tax=Halopseudomonas litoralis TaxID=797277 RepID=UPI001E352034|nr:hypothetical protein [Halopseudomonas litoralis]
MLGSHSAIAECAVISVPDAIKGELPVGLVVLKNGMEPAQLSTHLAVLLRDEIGALACYQRTLVVSWLPKTRSGKILRRILRQMVRGEDWVVSSTIDDPGCLGELAAVLEESAPVAAG